MNKLKTTLIVLSAVVLLAISQIFNTGLLLHGPLLLGTLYLIIKYRQPIATWFRRWPLPKFAIFLLSAVPFILFEENINCLPSGCQIIPSTLPFLLSLTLILGLITNFLKIRKVILPIVVFSLLGLVMELTYGVSAAEFRALPSVWLVFLSVWTALSYAYLVIVPMTILSED